MENKNENRIDIEIKTNISPSEKVKFVKLVYEICDINKGTCIPIVKDTFFNFALIYYFTDYDTENVINDFDKIYYLVNETDIVEKIRESVESNVIEELQLNVNKYFECMCGYKENLLDKKIYSLFDETYNIMNKINSDSFVSFLNNFSEFSNKFEPNNIFDLFSKNKSLFMNENENK